MRRICFTLLFTAAMFCAIVLSAYAGFPELRAAEFPMLNVQHQTAEEIPENPAVPEAVEVIESEALSNSVDEAAEPSVPEEQSANVSPSIRSVISANTPLLIIGFAILAAAISVVLIFRGKKQKKDPSSDSGKLLPTGPIEKEGGYLFGSCLGQGKRDYQEDSLWIPSKFAPGKPVIAVLADGMGGMENGAESSDLAVKKFSVRAQRIDPGSENEIPVKLWKICNSVNEDVYEQNSKKGMNGGATLVAVYIIAGRLYWISVGDSRIYLLRDGILSAVNEEHEFENSLYSQMLDSEFELIDIRETPNRELRKLTSNLGRENIPLIDQNILPYQLRSGDKLLLCSDGVSGTLSETEIVKCLVNSDPEADCDGIVKMIENKDKKGQDNYSAIVISVAEEDFHEN